MYEPLRIFGVLLYKSWMVRKKGWIVKLIYEIVIPLAEILLICSMNTGPSQTPVKVESDHLYEKQSLDLLLDYFLTRQVTTYYAPKNAFTDELMANVETCFKYRLYPLKGFASENELNSFYRNQPEFSSRPHAVIFDESVGQSTKYLSYKLRYLGEESVTGQPKPLYNGEPTLKQYHSKLFRHYMLENHLTQMQICVDRSFINVKSGKKPIPDMHIQRVPYPAKIKEIPIPFDDSRRDWFGFALMITSIFPLTLEIPKVMNEKFSGVNVLLSMYGISNALNLLSWITSGLLYLGVLFYLPIVIYFAHTPGNTLPYIHYGNPLLVYLVLIFYIAHLLSFGIHVSAYFSRALLVIIALIILTSVIIYLQRYAFTESTLYLAPYVGIVFPGILFNLAIQDISAYESKAEGIHWYNLFVSMNPAIKFRGSVGMFLILSTIGAIVHFLLAVYVYAVKPGKYGVAKHPLYFLNYQRKRDNDDVIETVNYDESNDEYFEPAPEGVYTPGIRIRNLKKTYNINLLSKQKVHALRGVSVDFYKGQMTSLLGHNGAGKTTLMSILTGVTSPTEGTVVVDSQDLRTSASEIIKDMGLCTQENMYFSSLTVSDQLLFFTMVKRKDQSQSSRRDAVKTLLLKLKLHDKKDAMPDKLSGGQKRRLCLGMALAGDASTLILDEPTSGLDPESRRVIWNILLKMRGQKTILISTHDMEEAEILGDRIAIMHTGLVKSYGTSLFLKRLIGQNYVEITLSIEPRSDPERIRSELSKEAIIVKEEASKMVVKIPNSPGLPDTLDNLEKKKQELGVTGFSVSLISLEQVFIKMTEENDGPMPQQMIYGDEAKLMGHGLYVQTVRALLSKKLTYALKDYSIIITKLLTIFLGLLITAMYLKSINAVVSVIKEPVSLPINLKMYHRPDVLYTSYDKKLGDRYKAVSRHLEGNPFQVTNTKLESALLERANDDPVVYSNYLIAAAELNESSVNALYSDTATYSLPISINLLSNSILQNLVGPDYSIGLSVQALPFVRQIKVNALSGLVKSIFVYEFCLTVAMFVVHPSQEYTTKIKHLQRMTGVSGYTYWGTMFLFDLMEYALLVVLLVIGFVCIDVSLELRLYGSAEIGMEILLFMIFGISTLPFIYLFSFFGVQVSEVLSRVINWTSSLLALDMLIAMLSIILKDNETVKTVRSVTKWIFRLIPCVSFSHCQMSFFRTVETNARCHRLSNDYYDTWCFDSDQDICCDLDCYDGKCKKSKPFFDDTDKDINLSESMIWLCVTAIVYFGLLAYYESRFRAKAAIEKNHDPMEPSPDEQVQREKSMIFERIELLRGDKPSSINDGTLGDEQAELTDNGSDDKMFLVYELKKNYDMVKAVRDVSFSVNRRECFVLLGVNGAGKSTTFRMMAGEDIPDHGTMYIQDKEFENNLKYCLSQIGYCPQPNASLKRLNSYDHLRLFARLRGIPEKDVENEVEAWIKILNLNAYALQPSGTYSGGNKRRLNIGIALIGNPNLILMDEPTTGVDPGARRSLWNVIKACQMAGQSVILTSHSMVECEALSDRLAIMVDGKLVCIGASEQLKQRFGAGYDIQIKMDPEKATDQVDSIKNDMAESLNCVLTDENLIYLKYHIAPAGTTWRKMYDVMNGIKKKYDSIDDFLVSSSSLEQLFLMFAKSASSSSSSESLN